MRRKSIVISPNDTNDLPRIITALYVGASGDITILCALDTTPVQLKNVAAGTLL